MRRDVGLGLACALLALFLGWPQTAQACANITYCAPEPGISPTEGAINVSYESIDPGLIRGSGGGDISSHEYRLRTPCFLNDESTEACNRADFVACDQPPDRVVRYLVLQQRTIVRSDGTLADGTTSALPPGTPIGAWTDVRQGCMDITPLNPPPTPEEVFRYFQTLPLPELATRQQPPGNALVGLPVIFFTDSPTTQSFTVDIRGFDVDIDATASGYAWDTGDGTVLTTAVPGAPYPDQTITHDYSSGTYTATLTTTWSATYSVDGGVRLDVPGTTTTEGLPVTFTVMQAHTVLTDPYD